MTALTWMAQGIILYFAIGILSAIILSVLGLGRIDPTTRGSSLGFRLAVLPGIVLLWPMVFRRMISGTPPPLEKTAHKELWGKDND